MKYADELHFAISFIYNIKKASKFTLMAIDFAEAGAIMVVLFQGIG